MDVTAGAFTYARRDRFMRFERTMHMDRDGQLIDANESHRASCIRIATRPT